MMATTSSSDTKTATDMPAESGKAAIREEELGITANDEDDGSDGGSTDGRRKAKREGDMQSGDAGDGHDNGPGSLNSSKAAGAAKGENSLTSLNVLGAGRRGNKPKLQVDREKTCPFLVRLFCKSGGHHSVEEYSSSKLPVAGELQIHTWKDASLRELASILCKSYPEAAETSAKITFRSAYQDVTRGGVYHLKELGTITNYRRTPDEERTLDEARFVIGDFIDVAILPNDMNNHAPRDNYGSGPVRSGGISGSMRHNPYGRPPSAGNRRPGGGGRVDMDVMHRQHNSGPYGRKNAPAEEPLCLTARAIGRAPPASAVIAEARASLKKPSRPFTPALGYGDRDVDLFSPTSVARSPMEKWYDHVSAVVDGNCDEGVGESFPGD
ncbi:Histone deacetylase complex subunit sap18 [Phlyctochytrium bullatum]|nr:Histone deacetylase complex subunit sap18 [Phlyctochytrium bullatum]